MEGRKQCQTHVGAVEMGNGLEVKRSVCLSECRKSSNQIKAAFKRKEVLGARDEDARENKDEVTGEMIKGGW